ncbi:ABC transporter permease [bacterium]|nr:ABC transporter permease [bacterium]
MIWTKAWRDFLSHRLALATSIFMMGLGIALLVAFSSAFLNLGQSARLTYQRLDFLDATCYLRHSSPTLTQRVLALSGVHSAEGRRSEGIRIQLPGGEMVQGVALGIPAERELTVNRLHLHQGDRLRNQRGGALLEKRFARAFGYQPGDTLIVQNPQVRRRFQVVGLVSSPEFLWLTPERLDPRPAAHRFGVMFISHKDMASLAGSDAINEIHVRFRPAVNHGSECLSLTRHLQGDLSTSVVPRSEQTSNALLERDRRAFAGVSATFPLVLIGLSGVMLFLTLWQLLHSQRKQIGTLFCLGFSRSRIAAQYLLLAAIVGALSGLVGLLLGPPLARLCTRYYVDQLGLPFWSDGLQVPSLLAGMALALVVSSLACLAALADLLRSSPLELLRQDFSPRPKLVSWLQWLPIRGHYRAFFPLRNLLRQPWRSMTMIGAIALSTSLILMTLSLFDSQSTTLDFYLSKIHRYDLKVDLAKEYTPSDLPPVEHWPGVQRVERVLVVGATLHHGKQHLARGIWGLSSDSQLLQLYDSQGRPLVALKGQGVLLAPIAWRTLDLTGEGQPVQLEISNGQRHPPLQSIVSGPLLYEPVLGPPKCELSDLQRYRARSRGGPREVVNNLLVQVAPRALESVRHRLLLDPRVHKVETMASLRRDIYDLLRMVMAYLSLMLGCSALSSIAMIHMGCTMNLSERSTEVAALLVQGVRRRDIILLLLIEFLYLWLTGLALGIGAGTWAGNWMLGNFQNDLIDLRLQLLPRSLLATAAFSLGLCLIACYGPIRRLLKVCLADAMRAPD